jgi:hypothetical protein
MGDSATELALEAYGVRARVSASSPDLLARVTALLPPGWRSRGPAADDKHFVITKGNGTSYSVAFGGATIASDVELDVALGVLDAQLCACVALHAPDRVFVHAGVVGSGGRAIVIPGPSFSGKTTLVAELVRAGADYYSDEFAVLDGGGLVHPYPRRLAIRGEDRVRTEREPHGRDEAPSKDPLPVGVIAVAHYRPGAVWQPRQRSAGEGVLALLANTVPAQERPAEALAALRQAVTTAVVVEGERGEAAAMVDQLLESAAG